MDLNVNLVSLSGPGRRAVEVHMHFDARRPGALSVKIKEQLMKALNSVC
jgi:hypothetical protein